MQQDAEKSILEYICYIFRFIIKYRPMDIIWKLLLSVTTCLENATEYWNITCKDKNRIKTQKTKFLYGLNE
jgi:hypothetical protein